MTGALVPFRYLVINKLRKLVEIAAQKLHMIQLLLRHFQETAFSFSTQNKMNLNFYNDFQTFTSFYFWLKKDRSSLVANSHTNDKDSLERGKHSSLFCPWDN
jgi:hypothetical protein